MQYNAMLGRSNPAPKGKGVFSTPCCLTCTKLVDNPRVRVPRCEFLKSAVSEALIWGQQQCSGYEPRGQEDFAPPGTKLNTSAGAKIVAPGAEVNVRKKTPRRTTIIIIPPSEVAFILPPKRSS